MADEKDEVIEKVEEKKTLSETIEDAAKKVEEKLEKKDEKVEKKEVKEDDEKEEEDEEDEDELSEEEQLHAKNLFKLLKNPTTQRQALETLVKAAGISDKSDKEEVKTVKKTIKEVLAEKLPNYKFLAGELGDALESILSDAIDEKTKDIKATLTKEAEDRQKAEVQTAQEKVFAEYAEVPDKVLVEMERITRTQELMPGKDMTPEKYLRALVRIAADNVSIDLIKKDAKTTKKENTMNRNRTDAMSRLASARVTSEEGKKVTQVKSLDDAINEAARLVEEKMGVG